MRNHAHARFEDSRRIIVPWLDAARPLFGARILELGCGTGSSTVALAEQGATVIGIDIDEPAMQVARVRAEAFGVDIEFRILNGDRIGEVFAPASFDLVVFYACLEHMTIPERLASLSAGWNLLSPGGLLVVIETPNRLWFFDSHTARLPFFNWLPDDLAFAYSRFSDRDNFKDAYPEATVVAIEHFLRRGRGASFHEFDLAISPVASLDVAGSLAAHRKVRLNPTDDAFKRFLATVRPDIHESFLDEYLNLIIRR